MSVREYIGARYVPLVIGQWDNTKTYEPLSIVLYEGDSYTSRQAVPIGIDISNETYWVCTGNYNAQIETYRQSVAALENALPITDFDSENTVKDYIDTVTVGTIKTYNTVAEMLVDDKINYFNYVQTIQYYASTNYGGSVYQITDESINNASLECENGYYATPIFKNNVIPISVLGAKDNTDSTDAIQIAFDIAYMGCEILFDVIQPIISEQITLQVNNVKLKSVPENYEPIITNIANDFAILINSHGCILEGMHFRNNRANGIDDVNEGDKCIRFIDLTQTDFFNIDCNINNCTFLYYGNCVTAYGKNCRIKDCIFSNSINAIEFIGNYNDVATPQRRGLFVSGCTFHGGSSSYTLEVPYNLIKTIAIKNSGGFREMIIENNKFNSDYCGYIFKGTGGCLVIRNNSSEDHTGAVGIGIIEPREDGLTHTTVIEGNNFNAYASNSHGQISHPFVWNSSETLYFIGNVLHGYPNMMEFKKIVSPVFVTGNIFYETANKYGDGLFSMIDQSANHSIALSGNLFNGGAGTMPLFYSNNTYELSAVNANYLDCNYINTNHFTVS